ncbi:hypothetical protein CVT25_002822 [Psilocybe cyanescens]|uniref:NmrA-like domain-containing protein n=1 Tax=Psilocybe cyanescens TaxID=93625 RepID=A0A409WL19_PSICY|nr:hypothetical protein CVT25_002822 [Psilocybe cyanescens]
MPSQINIFITGATGKYCIIIFFQCTIKLKMICLFSSGYIGGSVLDRLLKHPDASSFKITALVRSVEKGDKLKNLGVNIAIGTYDAEDLSFLTDAVSQADVVFSVANSDHPLAAQAILKGLKIKHEKSGKAPILIHTVTIIMDDSRGLTSEHITYSDLDVETLSSIPDTALHRNVDVPLIEADRAGYVNVYLVTPGTIFGSPSGQLVDLGIQNMHSIQIPYIIKPSIARKQGAYFSKGLNTWSAVSQEEVVDLYLILFDTIRSRPEAAGHGAEGYYFAENCEYSGIELARVISEALVEFGVGTSKEPSAFTQAELDTFFGPIWPLLATNSYAKGDRSRALGWNPKSTKKDFLENVRLETKAFLAESK